MRTAEPRLVGASRHSLVEGMVAVFDDVQRTGEPRWVSLEAPSGWGKTRIARELYERLAARQASPAYWPDSIVDADTDAAGAVDVATRRKRLNPDVVHVPGSLPGFLWWGISCSSRNGVPSVALAQDIGIFEAHAPYLDDAWLRLPRTSRASQDLRGFAAAAIDEVAMEAAGNVIEVVAGAAIPGLGLVRWVGEWAWGKRKDHLDRRDRLSSGDEIAPRHDDIADQLVSMLTRLARPGLPAVIVVEDLHDADDLLLDVLSRLAQARCAVLLITTGWPGHLEELDALATAQALAEDRFVRVSSEISAPLPSPFPVGSGLAPLSGADLADMLHHYFPVVEDATRTMIVERYTNPLALELFCQIDRLRRRFRDRELRLTASDLDHLPSSIRGLYRQHWMELPESVRHALAVATLGIPSVIEPDFGRSPLWNQGLMADALRELELPEAAGVAASLDSASTAYAWARIVTDTMRRFSEPDQLGVAVDDQRTYLFEDEVRTVKNLLAARLAARLPVISDATEKEHAARLLIALEAEGFVDDPAVLAAASLALLELLRDDERELVERIRIAEHALRVVDPTSDGGLALRRQLVNALRVLGRWTDAARAASSLIADLEVRRDPGDSELLEARFEHFAAMSDDLLVENLAGLEALAAETSASLGEGDLQALRSANLVSVALSIVGRSYDSIALLRRLHAIAVASLGSDARFTLVLASNLAFDLDRVGLVDEALALHRETLAKRTESLGPLHPDTLLARRNLIAFVIEAGRYGEAVEAAVRLLKDAVEGLGAEHPETQFILGQYIDSLSAAGRLAEAVEFQRQLVSHRVRSQGPDAANSLAARRALAVLLSQSGLHVEARAEFDAVLRDTVSVYGDDSSDALWVRLSLARHLIGAEGHDVARRELAAILEAASSRRATDAVISEAVDWLARVLNDLGMYDEAIAHLEPIVAAHEASDSPDVATIGGLLLPLAFAYRSSGRAVEIEGRLDRVYEQLVARYGSASPITISVLHEIVAVLRVQDRLPAATERIQEALGVLRTQRPEHDPQVLLIRVALGEVLIDRGDEDGGLAVLRDAREVAASGLGRSHESTLMTAGRLLGSLDRAGRSAETLECATDIAADLRARHGEASDAYRRHLWVLANAALSGKGELAAARPYLDELVSLIEADPEADPVDHARARLRRAFVALFQSDESCVAEFQEVAGILAELSGPDDADAEGARTLYDIAYRVWNDEDGAGAP